MQLFGISQYGKSKDVTAQNRLNAYMEVQPGDDKTRVAFYGTPSLDLLTSFGDTPIRGLYQKGDFYYVVHRGTFYEVNNASVKTVKGTINSTSGKVSMSDNGVQLMLTDGADGWIYNLNNPTPKTISSITHVGDVATVTTEEAHNMLSGSEVTHSGATESAYNGTFRIDATGIYTYTYTMLTTPSGDATVVGVYANSQFAKIVDEDYQPLSTVTWQDGYFIGNANLTGFKKRFIVSSIANGFLWDALEFASAESNPDDITVVETDNSNLYLFGEVSTEFWTNTGNVDFPFDRISGGAIEWGCAAVNSVVKFDNSLAFLAKNRMGEVIIARMQGYAPQRISNPELEYFINGYLDVADASFYSYMLGGHPMLQCNFPSAGKSWLYDGLSNAWSQLKSDGIARHRGEMAVNYINKTVVADYENGNIYRLNPDGYADNGAPIEFELISRHISQDNKRLIVDSVELEMEYGVGLATGQGETPQIMMQISKDGGHTFGNERWVGFGKVGQYKYRAIWRRCGQSRDFVFKFRITDPVKRVITNAIIQTRLGTS